MQLFAAIMRCEEADSEVKLIQRDAFVKTDTHASWSAQLCKLSSFKNNPCRSFESESGQPSFTLCIALQDLPVGLTRWKCKWYESNWKLCTWLGSSITATVPNLGIYILESRRNYCCFCSTSSYYLPWDVLMILILGVTLWGDVVWPKVDLV